MIALRLASGVVGVLVALLALRAAVRTFVLPRSVRDPVARWVFLSMRAVFDLRVRGARTYETRDRVMALYAPVTLLVFVLSLVALLVVGFTGIFWAVEGGSAWHAFELSGSSLLTLGFERPERPGTVVTAFVAAAIGLTLVALLVAYLPAMYTAFARREAAVTTLEVRAGSPPTGVDLLVRAYRIGALDTLDAYWKEWQQWFVELEESHTSHATLIFFRSPQAQRSWVTAAGAVLDAIAIEGAALGDGPSVEARLCLRAGSFALRRIAVFFELPIEPEPTPEGGAVSVRRSEFDAALRRLAAEGLPVRVDEDRAWDDFVGARLQYDEALIALAALTMAPYAPWASDRSLRPRARAALAEHGVATAEPPPAARDDRRAADASPPEP